MNQLSSKTSCYSDSDSLLYKSSYRLTIFIISFLVKTITSN